ncbi:tetratricopeptide repeat protein 32 isoform X1 [Amblyraja radiata]|uniref:tetratricopeptide repeat protein 32 isoform X1 n=2 Tax=Amblyraja radiata TaxID=386614 RepID=UPI00140424B9|nr:tetratricopeptide repeat protein 32 isoform X1 [Amblyraja radiata]
MECRAVLAEANMQFQRQDLMRAEESYSRFIHMCRERQQRVLMSNMEEWCRQHYLNDNTINQLKHQVLFTREGINSLTRNDIENMNISLGQKTALRHLLCSENAQARMKQSKIPQTDYIDYGWIHNITELFILCDGCGIDPIIGTRFVCNQCDNFDYCSTCFHTRNHKDHSFARIDYPGSQLIYVGRSGNKIPQQKDFLPY